MIIEFLLLLASCAIWAPVYVFYIIPKTAQKSRDHMIKAIESGEIDLNYLLEDVVQEIVVKVKQHALADLGSLTRAGNTSNGDFDPLQLSEQVLNGVGLKNPGPMLTVKMAQILGTLAERMVKPDKEVEINAEIPGDDAFFKP